MSPDTRNKAILILGMHRSGTSALTRVVNLLGANVGNDLLPAAADNPAGFWEHRGIVAIHDKLLQSMGRSWHDLSSMPQGWLESTAAQLAREQLTTLLKAEFSDSPLWAVKDPRLCRLLPLWHQVLDDLGVDGHAVLVLRHPDEVAASLLARNGLAVEYTRLSWVQHMAEAESGSRCFSRSIVSYDNLLLDWSSCMKRLSEEMQLVWPVPFEIASDEVSKFLSSGARHHELKGVPHTLPQTIKQIYEAFLSKANQRGESWQAVEQATSDYHRSAETFLSGIDAVSASLNNAQAQIEHKNVEIASLSARLDSLFRSMEENDSRMYLHHGLTSNGLVKDLAKLYFRGADERYAEERSVSIPHDGIRHTTKLRFELPEDCTADFIRFDPSEFPGEFLINAVQLGGVSINDFDHELADNGRQIVSAIAGELRIASVDADPHIEIDVRKLGLTISTGFVVELSCCRTTPYTELRDLVDSALAKQRIEVFDAVSKLIEQLFKDTTDNSETLGRGVANSDARLLDGHLELDKKVSQFAEKLETIWQLQQRADGRLDSLAEFARFSGESFAQLHDMCTTQSLQWDGKASALLSLLETMRQQQMHAEGHLGDLAGKLSALDAVFADRFRQASDVGSKQASAQETHTQLLAASLETVRERQQSADERLEAVAKQLGEFANACEHNFDRLRTAEEQQAQASYDLRMQLDAILANQKRSFMDRLRRKTLRGP